MINLIGAYITSIFILAILYHRPPVDKYEEVLIENKYLSIALFVTGVLLFLDYLFHLFSLGVLFAPFAVLKFLLETTTLWIHEAGHVYWGVFGRTFAVLGGTLNEVFFPCVFIAYCHWKGAKTFSALGVFWIGGNCFGIASYMADSRARELPLFGGAVTHDWEYLFIHAGVIEYDEVFAWFVYTLGIILCLASLAYFTYQSRLWRPHS